jgi:hypothetical protein
MKVGELVLLFFHHFLLVLLTHNKEERTFGNEAFPQSVLPVESRISQGL